MQRPASLERKNRDGQLGAFHFFCFPSLKAKYARAEIHGSKLSMADGFKAPNPLKLRLQRVPLCAGHRLRRPKTIAPALLLAALLSISVRDTLLHHWYLLHMVFHDFFCRLCQGSSHAPSISLDFMHKSSRATMKFSRTLTEDGSQTISAHWIQGNQVGRCTLQPVVMMMSTENFNNRAVFHSVVLLSEAKYCRHDHDHGDDDDLSVCM
jgi:hypothetical protein